MSATVFDSSLMVLLDRRREVEIQTTRPDGSLRRTIIWIVVDGDTVYVRSVRGDRGHWFQAALDRPDEVALRVDGHHVPVRAVAAFDAPSIARCSDALKRKYGERTQSARSMLREHVLATTLRLEPRAAP